MTAQPTRRTFVRAAAWTVPAVTVAAAAPAFAASATPNLSTSAPQAPAPTKFAANNIAVVSPPVFNNTGAVAATGITMTITSPVVISNYQLQLPFAPPSTTGMDPASQGISVSGLGTTSITVSFALPFNGFTLDATDGTMTMFVRSVFTFAGSIPASLAYQMAAHNGGPAGGYTVTL